MTKSKEVKVTVCPPAEQTVFFQEHQFDRSLGGTDPATYGNSKRWSNRNENTLQKTLAREASSQRTRSIKRKRVKRAEIELEGHENKEAILKILRSE